jgi:uncharacterized protein YdeI (YjbR/CyaY-like superfamily)
MNTQVDEYIQNADKWQAEMAMLQTILLDCGLTEVLKWRVPCFMLQKSNLILIGKFKAYVTLSFFKGVLLKDENGILVSPGENSQTMKMAKFTSVQQIIELEAVLKAYIYEAIEIENAGLKVEMTKSKNLDFPEELIQKLNKDSVFKTAFEGLTPGKQRGYKIYFSAAKQSATRTSRIEQYTERILKGQGFHDCVCGHSKRMPTCDGSHKYL